jgi:TolB-like protein
MEAIKTFPKEEINFELQRALNFPLLKSSPVLTSFLAYIVTETIEGRDRHIKEYSIAVNALNRSENFDSHEDAVVRIHAGRLRRILNEYYLTDGINNPICIFIPKGCYVPQFKEADKTNANRPIRETIHDTTKSKVAIFPFKPITQNHESDVFSQLLSEELSAELLRFKDICVIGYYCTEVIAKINENILEAGKLIGADYIITGIVQYSNQQVRIRANLLNTSTGEVLITKTIDKNAVLNLFEVQDEIIHAFIAAIETYYSVIFPGSANGDNNPY